MGPIPALLEWLLPGRTRSTSTRLLPHLRMRSGGSGVDPAPSAMTALWGLLRTASTAAEVQRGDIRSRYAARSRRAWGSLSQSVAQDAKLWTAYKGAPRRDFHP